MKILSIILTICSTLIAVAQSAPSPDLPLAGCYEVQTAKWKPPLEDDPALFLIHPQLHIRVTNLKRDDAGFKVERVEVSVDHAGSDSLWAWNPKGNRMLLSLGTDKGGFCGTLKPSGDGNLSGKLKEWCADHCEWKKSEVTISLHRIDCPK